MSKKCPKEVWGGREEHEEALEQSHPTAARRPQRQQRLRFQLGTAPHPVTELKGIFSG